MPDYRLEIINRQPALTRTAELLSTKEAVALDIETVEWWSRQREKIALIQFAFRSEEEIKVVVIDALADCDLTCLRSPLESPGTIKVIHNAAFDAVKLYKHYRIQTAPIYDTMLAARHGGERKYSLAAQATSHLNIQLNKNAQRSDWSRRPLDLKQIDYAARDAFAALLLYEHQTRRNLTGNYLLKESGMPSAQPALPLDDPESRVPVAPSDRRNEPEKNSAPGRSASDLQVAAQAILGIISELPGRYGPEQLSVSLGAGRVGLAGWLVDRFLGRESELDEETTKLLIADLCERELIRITDRRRLEATEKGSRAWRQIK